jgi:hypothetical protein
MALSFVEIDGQRLELMPTRAVLSPFSGGHDDGGASGVSY